MDDKTSRMVAFICFAPSFARSRTHMEVFRPSCFIYELAAANTPTGNQLNNMPRFSFSAARNMCVHEAIVAENVSMFSLKSRVPRMEEIINIKILFSGHTLLFQRKAPTKLQAAAALFVLMRPRAHCACLGREKVLVVMRDAANLRGP
jgi:hypothetical protein